MKENKINKKIIFFVKEREKIYKNTSNKLKSLNQDLMVNFEENNI